MSKNLTSLCIGLASVAVLFPQNPQPPTDPQSLEAVRNAVTRLDTQVLALTTQLNTLSGSTDSRFGGMQTALVPVGAVIDWYRPRPDTPVPDGFRICNGDTVTDPRSVFNGAKVPILTDKFIMGVTPDRLSEHGGSAVIPMDGGHDHGGRTAGFAT